MKRILIKQDDTLLANICSDISFFNKTFKNVLEAHNALSIGAFTEETFKGLITTAGAGIINQYKQDLNSQLDKTGVKNQVLRNIIIQGSDEAIHLFSQAAREFINTTPLRNTQSIRYVPRAESLMLCDLSFVNGDLVITDQAKENIMERDCRTYLESSEEINFYSMLKALESTLQEYTTQIKMLEIPAHIGENPLNTLDNFFDYDWNSGEFNIRPESIKWALKSKSENEMATKKILNRMTCNSNPQATQQNVF
jgi:hypothetical protein